MSNEKKTSSRRKRCAEEQTNADPSIATEPRRLTATKSRVADLFTTAAVPGRSATPGVFVASPNAAAARGDAVQATFDQKLSDYRHEIPDLRNLGMHYRPLGQLTGDHTLSSLGHCSTQQTSHPAATANSCRRNRTRSLADLLAAIARILARGQLHNAPSLHTAWRVQQFKLQTFTSWKSSTTSLQLPRQQPGSRSSNGAFLSGKNNNSNSRFLRTSRLRHQQCSLTVRISLQRPTFKTIPSVRIPGPVKLEPPRGSYPSPSGYVWWSRHNSASPLLRLCATQHFLSQFCACCSLYALEVCLLLSQC